MNQERPPAHPLSCPCEGCQGTRLRTPRDVSNPPGLSALRYRIGRYADFLSSMTSLIGVVEVPDPLDPDAPTTQPLVALTTRSPSDPTIALLDACALVGENLTFYQERIANEAYLPTAEEGGSLAELARLVGYTPKPGVAASVPLAFSLDVGSKPLTIPTGTRAQSVPAQGQTAQMFETLADIAARREWNNLKPLATCQQLLSPDPPVKEGEPAQTADLQVLFFKGTATGLKPNDPLLLLIDETNSQLWRARTVDTDLDADRTTVVADPWIVRDSQDALKRRAAFEGAVGAFRDARDLGFQREKDAADLLDKALADLAAAVAAPRTSATTALGSARDAIDAVQNAVAGIKPVDDLGTALSPTTSFADPPSQGERAPLPAALRTYADANGGRSAAIAIDLANRVDKATWPLAKATTPTNALAFPAKVTDALQDRDRPRRFRLDRPPRARRRRLAGRARLRRPIPRPAGSLGDARTMANAGSSPVPAVADAIRQALIQYIQPDPTYKAVDAALAAFDAATAGAGGAGVDVGTFFQGVADLRDTLNALEARINLDGTAIAEFNGSLDTETFQAVGQALLDLIEPQKAFLKQDSALADRLRAYLQVITRDVPGWVDTTKAANPDLVGRMRAALAITDDSNDDGELKERLTDAVRTLGVGNLLPTFRREARLFDGGAYPRLKPNFDLVLAKLQSINELIRLSPAAVTLAKSDAQAIRGLREFQAGDPVLAPLILLFTNEDDPDQFATKTEALWKNLSLASPAGGVPGTSEQGLGQSLQSDSERAVALLAALSPDRAPAIRAALANADVRQPLTFSVEALRAVAAPFGSIAPPRAKSQTTGGVTETTYEDWPLFDRVLTVSIPDPGSLDHLTKFTATVRDGATASGGTGARPTACSPRAQRRRADRDGRPVHHHLGERRGRQDAEIDARLRGRRHDRPPDHPGRRRERQRAPADHPGRRPGAAQPHPRDVGRGHLQGLGGQPDLSSEGGDRAGLARPVRLTPGRLGRRGPDPGSRRRLRQDPPRQPHRGRAGQHRPGRPRRPPLPPGPVGLAGLGQPVRDHGQGDGAEAQQDLAHAGRADALGPPPPGRAGAGRASRWTSPRSRSTPTSGATPSSSTTCSTASSPDGSC